MTELAAGARTRVTIVVVVATVAALLAPTAASAHHAMYGPRGVDDFWARPGTGQVALHWVNPRGDSRWSFDRVEVVMRKGGGWASNPSDGERVYRGSGTSATVRGLTDGRLYSFTIFPIGTQDGRTRVESPNHLVQVPREYEGPTAPRHLEGAPGEGRVSLHWVNPPDPPDASFSHVLLTRGHADGGGTPVEIYRGTGRAFVDTGLPDNAVYLYRVFAFDSRGRMSEYNGAQTGTARATRLTAAVSRDDVTAGTSVRISGRLTALDTYEQVWLPLPLRPVELWGRPSGGGEWFRIASGRTRDGLRTDGQPVSDQGTIAFTHTPSFATDYQLRFAGYGIDRGTVGTAEIQSTSVTAASTPDAGRRAASRTRRTVVRNRSGSVIRKPAPPSAPAVVRADRWYLRRTATTGGHHLHFTYGNAGDQQLLCDWNGSGVKTPGVFGDGRWYLRNANTSGGAGVTFRYGQAGDTAVCGDWDGDGVDTVGVRRDARWLLRNSNTAGDPHRDFAFGRATDRPVVGDWDGNLSDTVGVVRAGRWYLRNANSAGRAHRDFDYGKPNDVPVVGDWDGDYVDTVGVVRGTRWLLRNRWTGGAQIDITYGKAGDRPLTWR